MVYKDILGAVTLLIAVISYSFYFHDIFSGKTKPHAFSWFVWSVISAIAFFAQLIENAGPGAWITGFTAVVCFLISVIASFKSNKAFKVLDWCCLAAALFALVLWHLTNDPTIAVVLVSLAYVAGFIPTILKGFNKPGEETLATFALNSFKFALAIPALTAFNLVTLLYPLTLVVMNASFVVLLLLREKQL